jgi:hypothetical protein
MFQFIPTLSEKESMKLFSKAYWMEQVPKPKPTRLSRTANSIWKLMMLWMAVAGTVSLALWCVEEATQTSSMAVYNCQKAGDAEATAKALTTYDTIVKAGQEQNDGIGQVNPLTKPAYDIYFDKAAPAYSESVKVRMNAEKGKADAKGKVDAPPVVVTLKVVGETEKSWQVETTGGPVYLPKSQVQRDGDSFTVPAWLVRARSLDGWADLTSPTGKADPIPDPTPTKATNKATAPKEAKTAVVKEPKKDEPPVTVTAQLIGETEKSFKVQQGEVIAFLPKSITSRDGERFTAPLWIIRMKKLAVNP